MVTRHEIYESKMGNRVSKSEVFTSVKEQRVDGSCFLSCDKVQEQEVKVYSNGSTKVEYQGQILSKSSLAKSTPRELENSSDKDLSSNVNRLDPMFVTGFTDLLRQKDLLSLN
jgi:hypothetical protein